MLALKNQLQYMDIIEHPHHFYEFIFRAGSPPRYAYDDWVTGVGQLYQLPLETPIKLLTNAHYIEAIPMTYAFQQSRVLLKNHPIRPRMRSVFLMTESQSIVDRMFQSFAQLFRTGNEIRTLYGDKRADALEFLFANEPENHPQRMSHNA